MIYLIYSPSERPIAERLANTIGGLSGLRCTFAPLGLKALSNEWCIQVQTEIKKSDAVLILITDISLKDETVVWRVEQSLKLNKILVPVLWNDAQYPSPQEIDPRITDLTYFNAFQIREEFLEEGIKRLVRMLPAETSVFAFLSYSRKDVEIAEKLANDLRKAKVQTWRDADDIPAGANWDREIEKAIRECTHLILVASPSSVQSENVMDEISLALNKGKTIIPVMIETCELPLRVHRAQWVDFREDYALGLTNLLSQIGGEERTSGH